MKTLFCRLYDFPTFEAKRYVQHFMAQNSWSWRVSATTQKYALILAKTNTTVRPYVSWRVFRMNFMPKRGFKPIKGIMKKAVTGGYKFSHTLPPSCQHAPYVYKKPYWR